MFSLMALVLTPSFVPVTPPPPEGPTCGLGASFHSGRRAELLRHAKDGLLLFRGLPETRAYLEFRQDKTFWYLTGVESPGAALLMDAKSGRQVLFLPRPNPGKESWEGEIWDSGDSWVKELTGFEDVRPAGELMQVLEEWTVDEKTIWISKHPHVATAGCFDRAGPFDRAQVKDPLDGRPSREAALEKKLMERLGVEVKSVDNILFEMRRVKTTEELDAMRRAGRAGAIAMSEAMRSTRSGVGEWELDALMGWVHQREGADGPAYHAIVGSGPNSLVLHYSASTRRMESGEVVLLDFGPEVDHYTTDITRTWPVDGKFTPRMRELYDAVLAAQKAGIAAVHPGATLGEVEAACSAVLKERGLGDLIRHGSCHYIGLEVHDVGAFSKPLVPGVVFTVEPGVYETKTNIGIRIEDVVVVTEDGCEVITDMVPKDRRKVERLVAEKGILDRR
jgi:Xaa-Pro aminopeptidase